MRSEHILAPPYHWLLTEALVPLRMTVADIPLASARPRSDQAFRATMDHGQESMVWLLSRSPLGQSGGPGPVRSSADARELLLVEDNRVGRVPTWQLQRSCWIS